MRTLIVTLFIAFVLLQYRLWVGDGGILEVRNLQQELQRQEANLERLRDRNSALAAEVQDLKQGYEAIEERARSELGMIRKDEVFYQVVEE